MSAVISGLLPKIEGFQPIPNAVMIPFMEAQSAALAYGFGLNYEYGKRKIRSMSNEEYNSLTSEDITNMSNNHTHIILSKFQAAVPAVMPMQKEIFKQYVLIEQEKVKANIQLAQWMVHYAATNIPQAIEDAYKGLTGQIEPVPGTEGTTTTFSGDGSSSTEVTPEPTPTLLTEKERMFKELQKIQAAVNSQQRDVQSAFRTYNSARTSRNQIAYEEQVKLLIPLTKTRDDFLLRYINKFPAPITYFLEGFMHFRIV